MFELKPFRKRKHALSAESQKLKMRIYQEHERFIYYYALKLSKTEDNAYMLVSNAWHFLMQKADELKTIMDDTVRMRSYIASVLHHQWQHMQRDMALKSKYDALYHQQNMASSVTPDAGEEAERRMRNQQVLQAVQKLPGNYRDVILMRYFEGRSTEEIAAHLGLSPASVNQYVKRARENLKTILIEDGVVEEGYDYE
ncbi:MAG: sigma-70 family RNA polymerase sigma factor [Clostridiales bacterium]|nr:sigma-70 family RNA polymerase sigma factor [Clostridiales bacterium]